MLPWCITRFLPSSKGIILKAAYKSKKDGRAFITRRVVQVASRHTLTIALVHNQKLSEMPFVIMK
jgi:hypothetical protein